MILQKREKIILVITLAIMSCALFYSTIAEPFYKKWTIIEDDLRSKQILLGKSRRLLSQKEALARELKEIRAVAAVQSSLEEYAAKFLLKMETLARRSGISQITSISPLPVKEERDIQLLQTQINFDATVNSLTNFLYAISRPQGLLHIERLQIDNNMETPELLKCQVIISTIFLKPEIKVVKTR